MVWSGYTFEDIFWNGRPMLHRNRKLHRRVAFQSRAFQDGVPHNQLPCILFDHTLHTWEQPGQPDKSNKMLDSAA